MLFTDKSNLVVSHHVSQYYIVISCIMYPQMYPFVPPLGTYFVVTCPTGYIFCYFPKVIQIKYKVLFTNTLLQTYYLHSNIPPLNEKQLTLSSSLSCCFLSRSLLYHRAHHLLIKSSLLLVAQ